MDQIMRLRRRATGRLRDQGRATTATATRRRSCGIIEKWGTLHEAQMPSARSARAAWSRGQLEPSAVKQLLDSAGHRRQHDQEGRRRGKAFLHHKLPDQKNVRRIFKEIESQGRAPRAEPLHRRRADDEEGARRRSQNMKLAYWPGCVSRGFTPELHGSMAKVAPKLDLELVELDRANCCGAGVIAEHNQELADTLNARTFAMAQGVDGAAGMMNICSTCQGAQSECQERLDADTAYREHINGNLDAEGLHLRARRRVVEQELPLAAGRGDRARHAAGEGRPPARGAARRAVLRLLHRPAHAAARLRRPPRARHATSSRSSRRSAATPVDVRGQPQVLRLPGHHDEQGDVAAPGRPPHGRRARRRRGLRRHAVPALPPEPGPPAARRRELRRARPRHAGAALPADRRARARARAEGARDEQARRLDHATCRRRWPPSPQPEVQAAGAVAAAQRRRAARPSPEVRRLDLPEGEARGGRVVRAGGRARGRGGERLARRPRAPSSSRSATRTARAATSSCAGGRCGRASAARGSRTTRWTTSCGCRCPRWTPC